MQKNKKNVLIVGAGDAGKKLIREIRRELLDYHIVAYVDDDAKKIGQKILGVEVKGLISLLPKLVERYKIEEVLIAIPSSGGKLVQRVFQILEKQEVDIKIIPSMVDVIEGRVRMGQIRTIKPEDLLVRPIVKHDLTVAKKKMKDKVVLITGAAGSIGSESSKQAALLKCKQVVCFDWWENGLFHLERELKSFGSSIEYVVGSIQDRNRLEQALSKYKPDVIFHAAAYKHVPVMENNIVEAIKNNIFGTKNVVEAAVENNVKDFILISTDKAINPISVMGATKRVTEKLMSVYADKQNKTRFTAVRFGNVLGSEGSVVQIFEEQLKQGGPLTVTHPEMVRYFMTIGEAVQLVIQSWGLGKNGELFVLDMGKPVNVLRLARYFVKLYGRQLGKRVKIKIVGLRPGEKLFEEILLDKENVIKTEHSKIFVVKKSQDFAFNNFLVNLKKLESLTNKTLADDKELLFLLKKLVPNFQHQK